MIREAVTEDREAIDSFLRRYTESSMFLRSNLAGQGIGWSDHAHSTRFFLWSGRDGIEGVFGLTRAGFLLAQAANLPDAACKRFADAIVGETVIGMIGLSDQVSFMLSALGLETAQYDLNHEEPLCRCALNDLQDPGEHDLRQPEPETHELLVKWFSQYNSDTGLATSGDEARRRADAALNPNTAVRLLYSDGAPVAMAAINARVEGFVQLGGVFVPPEFRGRGMAQRVTKAILWEACKSGAHTGVLMSNNDIATRAYVAVGFRPIATFRIAILAEATPVGAAA